MTNLANRLDRYERLRASVETPAAWKPEPGETILGRVLGWNNATTRDNGACEVLTIETPEGIKRSVWTWHAQLRYKLIAPKEALGDDRLGSSVPHPSRLAREGDFVAIHFRGKSTMDDGNEAASYRVGIERSEESGEEPQPDSDGSIPF